MTAFKALQEQNRYIRAGDAPAGMTFGTSEHVSWLFSFFVFAVMMPWTLSMTISGTSPSWSTSLVSFHYRFLRTLITFSCHLFVLF